jgi:hypothetical protein
MNTTESDQTSIFDDEHLRSKHKAAMKSPNRRATRLDHFSDMKKMEDMKMKETIEEEDDYDTMKKKIEMIDRDEISDQLNTYVFIDANKRKERLNVVESNFTKTRYAEMNAFSNFYEKYRYSEKLIKKGIDYQTPSFNFISAIKTNKIIPNPVGILKRSGNENILNLRYVYINIGIRDSVIIISNRYLARLILLIIWKELICLIIELRIGELCLF